ncbi:MAG: hypothetical protein ACR2MC_00025 [Actinomycetota bacterium]
MTTFDHRRDDLDPVIEWVLKADPLEGTATMGWSYTHQAEMLLRTITAGETSPVDAIAVRPRRRSVRPLLVAFALLALGGTATGARLLLGGPAPNEVQRDLGAVDQGMPADLRYNPDILNARLVAQGDGAQIYAADLPEGGYCAEIVIADAPPAGAVCTPTATLASKPIDATVPFVDPVTIRSPFIVGGRVNVPGATSLEAVFRGGTGQQVMLGDGGFFVFAVSADHLVDAHRHGLSIVATDSEGAQIASTDVPGTDFRDPREQDAKQPIFVSTISRQHDFTKVLGIEGSVNVAGAASLELRYPDGTVVHVGLAASGHYHYDLPADRQDDLYELPGQLVVRDGRGKELASHPVAAVAFWRSEG